MERSNQKKKKKNEIWSMKNIFSFRSAKEQESCSRSDQISASWEFVLNPLQKHSMGSFW